MPRQLLVIFKFHFPWTRNWLTIHQPPQDNIAIGSAFAWVSLMNIKFVIVLERFFPIKTFMFWAVRMLWVINFAAHQTSWPEQFAKSSEPKSTYLEP